jgi:hypothetical protein
MERGVVGDDDHVVEGEAVSQRGEIDDNGHDGW